MGELGGTIAYLVRRRVFAEANVTVNAENNILGGQLWDGFVNFNECLCGRLNKRLPVF